MAARGNPSGWAFALALAVSGTAAAANMDMQYLEATALYDDGHYGAAYLRLAELADGGHADAARMALLMVRFGPELYGSEWQPPARRVERWLDAATATREPRGGSASE